MLNINSIKSFTDLRTDPEAVAKLANTEGAIAIVSRSNVRLVAMSPKEYETREKLLQEMEDRLDAMEIDRLEKTAKKGQFTSHEQLFKELGIK